MRTMSAGDLALVSQGAYATYGRARVDSTGTGSYVDLSTLGGQDWLQELTWNDSTDDQVVAAKVTLTRSVARLSVAPLMTGSKFNSGAPLLAVGRRLNIDTATVPVDVTFANVPSTQWVNMFQGYIDDIDVAKDGVVINCRDLGGLLQDTFIETQYNYGSTAGVAIQTVIQSIINDHVNTVLGTSITLQVVGSPSFVISTYAQQKEPVMDAIQKLADQMGWMVRYRFNSSNQFLLTLYDPGRNSSTSLQTFAASQYWDVSIAKVSRVDLRNRIGVVFSDSANAGTRTRTVVDDTVSEAAYGLRYMEITEAATSQISTNAAATAMANSALSDLSQPYLEQTVTMPYFYGAELCDTYTWKANYKHYDTDQPLAVVSYSHDLKSDGTADSEIGVRGKPSGGTRKWLQLDGRPGVAPNAKVVDPNQPGMSIYGSPSSLVVDYDQPDPTNWKTTEVYMCIDSGVPIAQAQTTTTVSNPSGGTTSLQKWQRPTGAPLVATGRQTRFVVDGLIPGTTYRVGVVVIDLSGNIGQMSAQQLSTAQTIGPYQENLNGQQDQLVRNPDLNIYTLGTGQPPDAWTTNFTWSSANIDAANSQTGSQAVVMPQSAIPSAGYYSMTSALFPVSGSDVFAASFAAEDSNGTGSIVAVLSFYTATKTLISSVSQTFTLSTAYQTFYLPVSISPATARFASISFQATPSGSGAKVWVDRGYCSRARVSFSSNPVVASGYSNWTSGGSIALNFPPANATAAGFAGGGGSNAYLQIIFPGTYYLQGQFFCVNAGSSPPYTQYLHIDVSTNNGSTWTTVASVATPEPNGTWSLATSAGPIDMHAGDRIRWVLGGAGGGNVVLYGDPGNTQTIINFLRAYQVANTEQ